MRQTSFLLLLSFVLFSFSTDPKKIDNCFINFNKAAKLSMTTPVHQPGTAEKLIHLQTEKGDVAISRIDSYNFVYNNKKKVPFINVRVELSAPDSYGSDTINILEHLKYVNAHESNTETKDLIELNYNGYRLYGLSHTTIEPDSMLGTFVMFPGNDITIYFDFKNPGSTLGSYTSLDDYKSQRNSFLGEYINHLNTCYNK